MNWLKDRPVLQLILNGLIMFLGLLIMFWIQTAYVNDNAVVKDIETLKIKKADVSYVDEEIKSHANIEKLRDEKQDEKIETMRKEWREDQKEILKLIRGL